MGIVVDLIIVAIIALSTFLAYKKGLVALAIKLCAVIIALIITLLLYKPISNLIINTTNIDETIQNAILEKSNDVLQNGNSEEDLSKEVLTQAASGQIAQTAKDISIQVVNTGVIIILFFGIKFALRFVTALADKVAKLPIINQFNKIGGILYGLIRGLVLVYACLLLIGFAGQVNKNNYFSENVEKSFVGKMMYENNILKVLF